MSRKICFKKGEDVERLESIDPKRWVALSCPTKGLRFDERMLELMDLDHDGCVRTPEVLAAVAFLKAKGVDFDSLFSAGAAEETALAEVLKRQTELDGAQPSEDDRRAMAEWEAKGREVCPVELGDQTAAAEAAFAAVETLIDGYFAPSENAALVLDDQVEDLPLSGRLNFRYYDQMTAFVASCVKPLFGDGKESLSFSDWKGLKAKFAPYRDWLAAKPVLAAPQKDALDDEERILRYKLHLVEFLENFVSMQRLYRGELAAIFQTGVLRIDGRDLKLCFHVEDEGAHAALAAKSNCCLLYVKLTRSGEAARQICAVVTAGPVAALYVGRNGVFYDRDGRDWAAVVTKMVEAQVSLKEAFWAPWKKIGEGVAATVKKFLGDRQAAATASVSKGIEKVPAGGAESGNGAAMASSVAAIGIGVGMVGAACASLMAAVSHMTAAQIALSVAAIVLVVSLPSVILTWFRLRTRDLGAILNASGWAINRPMRFSMKRARAFTVCA